MDRRQFLRAALSLAPALVIVPPAVSYFLAPRAGWPDLAQGMIGRYLGLEFYVQQYAKVLNELVAQKGSRLRHAAVHGSHRLDLSGAPDQFYVTLEDDTRVKYDYLELFHGPDRPESPKTTAMRSPLRFRDRVARAFERARQEDLARDVIAYGGVA